MDTPTPVAALTVTELSSMAPGQITNALTQLPQLYSSATAANFNTPNNGFFTSPGGGVSSPRGVCTPRSATAFRGTRTCTLSELDGARALRGDTIAP